MKLEGDIRRSQRACQQLDTQKVILLPAFSLVKCFGTQYDLPCIFFLASPQSMCDQGSNLCPLHWKCALCIGSVES